LNQTDFYKIQYEGQAIEDDREAMIFNLVAWTIPNWWMFRLLRREVDAKLAPVIVVLWNFLCW